MSASSTQSTVTSSPKPIAVYYEHPEWFRPLFAELDRRGLAYDALDASRHRYDATNGDGSQYGLVLNRMSPSAHLRGMISPARSAFQESIPCPPFHST